MPNHPNFQKHAGLSLILALAIMLPFVASTSQALAIGDNPSLNASSNTLINLQNDINVHSSDPEFALMDNLFSEGFDSDNHQMVDQNRIEIFTTNIPQLDNRERTIIVYLPSDYETGESSYPVIYLQGAQDVFFQDFETNQVWIHNQPMLDFYTSGYEGEAILVGVDYNPYDKWDEYSPWVNDDMYRWMDPEEANRVEGGDGDAYLDFLINSLKPEIDSRYRSLQDRGHTYIGGYDMGGLISLYAVITRPDVYAKVMALSPAVWFAEDNGVWLSNNQLIDLISSSDLSDEVTFYIDVADEDRSTDLVVRPVIYDAQGKKISFPRAYLEGAYAVVSALVERGHSPNKINSEIAFQPEWSQETSTTSRSMEEKYYFPIFYKHTPSKFESFTRTMHLNRERKIWVYLPPNYNPDSDLRYQVIYVTSAQYMFGEQIGAYLEPKNDWKFDETLDRLYNETGIGTIAIGIEYDNNHPWDEYMPWENKNMYKWVKNADSVNGVGDLMLEFIVDKLKPEIDETYNTNPAAEYTAIAGGSRSGLFALYASLAKPEVFSGSMAMSPAVWMAEGGPRSAVGQPPYWFANNGLDKWLVNNQPPTNVKYFLHIGTNETSGMPGAPYPYAYLDASTKVGWKYVYENGADRIVSRLKAKVPNTNVKYHKTNEDHLPRVWGKYADDALIWFGFYD